jgi:hypothetical protein
MSNKAMKKISLVLLTVSILSGCSLVKLTPAGENVAVLLANQVGNCQQTGATTVSVVNKVVVNRDPQRVAVELRTLARNHAADRGDVIVATSGVSNGEQSFNIYRCRN